MTEEKTQGTTHRPSLSPVRCKSFYQVPSEHVNKNSKWMQQMDSYNKKIDALSRSMKMEMDDLKEDTKKLE